MSKTKWHWFLKQSTFNGTNSILNNYNVFRHLNLEEVSKRLKFQVLSLQTLVENLKNNKTPRKQKKFL